MALLESHLSQCTVIPTAATCKTALPYTDWKPDHIKERSQARIHHTLGSQLNHKKTARNKTQARL